MMPASASGSNLTFESHTLLQHAEGDVSKVDEDEI
jgi:hypothetical protein